MYIESAENKKFKLWQSLNTKKHRIKEKKFLLESIRGIEEGLKTGFMPLNIILKEGTDIPESIDQDGLPQIVLTEELFNKISQTEKSQGVIGVYGFLEYKLKDLMKKKVLFLDSIQDPGNLGTIIRTGAALGIGGILLGPGCVDLYNDKVLRSSLGGLFSLPIVSVEYDDLKLFKKNNYNIIAMDLEGIKLSDYTFQEKTVIIIGNENKGISDAARKLTDSFINIPISEGMESLNASIAAAIVMYELNK
ncbi:MAG: RNA methyltransferase [Fusobacteria bacterium]|nr:RNA methyltransferase [Fusobacteriota bacterium]